MAKRRDILSTLKKPSLVDLAAACGMDGLTNSRKKTVLDALVKLRRLSDHELLDLLKRDDLKAACRELGLEDSGRAKQKIIARLLGGDRRGQSASVGKPTTTRTGTPRPMAKKKSKSSKRPIEQYDHADKLRANNPPVGLVTHTTDPEDDSKTTYQYDPHLDPQLVWAGKAERTSFAVPTVSLHVHERIDPRTIIDAVRARNGDTHADGGQMPLFESPDENPPLRDALDFYRHPHNWTNRLIAGDSLLVMNSLLEKEGMAGKVQMVYMDPPYGIRYGSNFQPFVNKRDIRDGKDDDLTQEPETLKAFRDTWELGIHSYLTYVRDRLLIARDLLHDSGSCFVQISDENLHHVRELMDEVFGTEQFISVIAFTTTTGFHGTTLSRAGDYLVWYAKNREQIKYRQLFQKKEAGQEGASKYRPVNSIKSAADLGYDPDELAVSGALTSQGASQSEDQTFTYKGKDYTPPSGTHWKTTIEGMHRLARAGRLVIEGNQPRYLRFFDDYPVYPIHNIWTDTAGVQSRTEGKIFVVQTATEIVKRCMLMTTDPGDLVVDPTCGSGTTAVVAEQWGRRWVTTDTSRVAIALAKQRLMTSCFDYFKLAHPDQGVGSGFEYDTVPHITLRAIANNDEIKEGMSREQIDRVIKRYADQEVLYDHPVPDRTRTRVTGPFTVEAVPSLTVRPLDDVDIAPAGDESVARSGPTVRQDEWRAELLQTGIRGRGGQQIEFSRIEPLGGTRYLHAAGETKEKDAKRVVVSFGPEHAPLEQRQVEQAWEEARTLNPTPDMLIFASFQFDPEAAKDIDELKPEKTGMTFLKVQMNADLLTEDLKKKRASNESFWLIGQPDITLRRIHRGQDSGKWQLEVLGFDYYNPRKGTIESGDTSKIAMWMLDTDYDGRSLYPRQVFFPMASASEGWGRLAKTLQAEIDQDLIDAYRGTVSLPFDLGEDRRVAVKIVDDRGIESLRILTVEQGEQ